jgi:hypothetical protein
MTNYDVYILDGTGYANGVNEQGEVVGTTLDDGQFVSSWWIPNSPFGLTPDYLPPIQGVAGGLTMVDNLGCVVPDPGPALFNINSMGNFAPLPFTGASALNNRQEVVVGNVIFNWLKQKTIATIPSLPGQTGIQASAINNLGDVVGRSGSNAFFYSAGAETTQEVEGGNVFLADINDNQTAVGVASGAVYIELSQENPQLQSILLPYEDDPTVGLPPDARAINSGGTIVGFASGAPGPISFYPFVFEDRQSPAVDLNTLVLNNPGWHLADAFDINDAGSIVGQAFDPEGQEAAYIAIPRVPLHGTLPLLGLIGAILRDLIPLFSGPLQGNPVPPRLPAIRSGLPLEQRETLLSFAMSNLASLMSDREARTRIQSIAAEVASHALPQSKQPPRPTLSQAQKEQIAKARKRMAA